MKVSVSLSEEDVHFLDDFATAHGLDSRSAALQRAVRTLRALTLADDYAAAWSEWMASDDAALWDTLLSDGLAG